MDRNLSTPNAVHYFWLALTLLLLTVYGSLIPLNYQPIPFDQAWDHFTSMGYYDPTETGPRADWVVNMVQYAAVSFCIMAAVSVDRPRWVGLMAAVVVIPAGCTLASVMEFVQIYFPPRTISANDILVECVGVVFGCAAWLVIGQRLASWLRGFWGRKGLGGLAEQILPAYLGLLLVVHLMPFDLVLSLEELDQKMTEGRIYLLPFTELGTDKFDHLLHFVTNSLAFLPIGALVALIPRWSQLRWPTLLGIGLSVTLVVESLQMIVFSRYCMMTDVLTGTAAILLGWWAVRALRDSRTLYRIKQSRFGKVWEFVRGFGDRRLWLGLALAWGTVVVLVNWYPYHFTADPNQFLTSDAELSDENTTIVGHRRMSFAPFVDYYWGSRYQALDQFVRRSLSFAPVGVFLALAFGSRGQRGTVMTVLGAILLGIVVEFGQYYIPERHPGVTDLLIQVFGAWLGYKLTRHVTHALAAPTVSPYPNFSTIVTPNRN